MKTTVRIIGFTGLRGQLPLARLVQRIRSLRARPGERRSPHHNSDEVGEQRDDQWREA